MAGVHTRAGRRDFLKAAGAAGAAAAVAGFPVFGRAQARGVKVGYILPVTGPLAFEAALALNGIQLAVDEINAGGGVKSLGGAKLVLLPGDTQNKVDLGKSEAQRLIEQGAVALIGPFSSLVAFSVRQDTEKAKTPFLLLAAAMLAHPRLAGVDSVELTCREPLVEFYRRFGFTDRVGGSRLMRRTDDPRLTG